MAQAGTVVLKVRNRSQVSPCRIYGAQSGTETGGSTSKPVLHSCCHYMNAPYPNFFHLPSTTSSETNNNSVKKFLASYEN
jgi:hypothetical protein